MIDGKMVSMCDCFLPEIVFGCGNHDFVDDEEDSDGEAQTEVKNDVVVCEHHSEVEEEDDDEESCQEVAALDASRFPQCVPAYSSAPSLVGEPVEGLGSSDDR